MNLSEPKMVERYRGMMRAMLGGPERHFAKEAAGVVQVERGGILALAVREGKYMPEAEALAARLVELAQGDLTDIRVADREGHERPVYRGLMIYGWAQGMRLMGESLPLEARVRWERALHIWCDGLQGAVLERNLPDGALMAAGGGDLTRVFWSALALSAAGALFQYHAWTLLASAVFRRLRMAQRPNGAYLTTTRSDNPETAWYHELVLLHAAASYAAESGDEEMKESVRRNAAFHLEETQPDHASNQPWGLLAFLMNPDAWPLVDQVLHTARVTGATGAGGVGGVGGILVADALVGLGKQGTQSR